MDRFILTDAQWAKMDGVGELEMALRRAGKGYVLGANATDVFNSWGKKPPVAGAAEAIAAGLEEGAWQRLSAGDGTKGERLYDWAYCELADLDAAEYGTRPSPACGHADF